MNEKEYELPKGVVRDPKSGALIVKNKDRGKNIDLRIFRKIIKEIYNVLTPEMKEKMKPSVRTMIKLL